MLGIYTSVILCQRERERERQGRERQGKRERERERDRVSERCIIYLLSSSLVWPFDRLAFWLHVIRGFSASGVKGPQPSADFHLRYTVLSIFYATIDYATLILYLCVCLSVYPGCAIEEKALYQHQAKVLYYLSEFFRWGLIHPCIE